METATLLRPSGIFRTGRVNEKINMQYSNIALLCILLYSYFVDGHASWFLSTSAVQNRTGRWFAGVAALKTEVALEKMRDSGDCSQLSRSDMDGKFAPLPGAADPEANARYEMQTYTTGCYYLHLKTDEWVSDGLEVLNTTRLVTTCAATHLTSFATGFFPEVNTIDFEVREIDR